MMTYPVSESLSVFFSQLSAEYDQSILRGCPPYLEMLDALMGYSFLERDKSLAVLELGCGPGNVSRMLVETYPNADLSVVDLSEKMLEQTLTKVRSMTPQIHCVNQGFMELTFPENKFDLVISSMALHHLFDTEKEVLYRRIFRWLKPGGEFRCADQCLGLPADKAHTRNLELWQQWAKATGASEEELTMWLEHATQYDHYASLTDHFRWLSSAGFVEMDCYWRKVYWTVFGAQKPL